tara:strand:+ start:472 stop:741 length:270 start_codon:yes stop_codon:yes gene_type:complete
MKFNELIFKNHFSAPGEAIQATAKFPNDVEVSIVAGRGLYSTPGGFEGSVNNETKVSSFEVGIFRQDDAVEILGWQSREDIELIFNQVI